jgi:hypothetical protein
MAHHSEIGGVSGFASQAARVAATVQIAGNTTAPFVYFDNVSACGVLAGAIQLELVANALLFVSPQQSASELVAVAHLRCSPQAAVHLRDIIQKALDMLAEPQITPGYSN